MRRPHRAPVKVPSRVAGSESAHGDRSMWFYRLFAFADGADVALMALGVLGVAANGAALPLMTVVFGRLIGTATRDVVSRVFAVSVHLLAAAIPSNMITKTFLYFYTTL
jgi:ATP-binding cassette, subfamily B (MDR/TAP), member 1